jgi:hypothetical protein
MFWLIIWLVLAVVVGVAANSRGRNGFGWFVLGIVISPLIAGLLLAILPDLRTRALLEKMTGAVDDEALHKAVHGKAATSSRAPLADPPGGARGARGVRGASSPLGVPSCGLSRG